MALDVHVIADPDGGWNVIRHGRRAVSSPHAAVRGHRWPPCRARVDLVTYGRDGRIRSKDSYGNERPTTDTEH